MTKNKLPAKLQRDIESRMEELRVISDELAPVLARQQQLSKELSDLKVKIKEYADNVGLPDGGYVGTNPRFEIKLGTRRTGELVDIDAVKDPALLEEIEVDHIIERDGKYYQVVGNTKAFNENYKKLGLDAEGWTTKTTRTISFKIDGKAV